MNENTRNALVMSSVILLAAMVGLLFTAADAQAGEYDGVPGVVASEQVTSGGVHGTIRGLDRAESPPEYHSLVSVTVGGIPLDLPWEERDGADYMPLRIGGTSDGGIIIRVVE